MNPVNKLSILLTGFLLPVFTRTSFAGMTVLGRSGGSKAGYKTNKIFDVSKAEMGNFEEGNNIVADDAAN
jgi:hypothetical protein